MKTPLLKSRFMSSDRAKPTRSQHRKPCADCPFARTAIKGWLGLSQFNGGELAKPQEWTAKAHGEAFELCHCTTNQQCAGLAIFRANLCKIPKHSLVLEPDEKLVFSCEQEFIDHHSK